ncbi:hypothetical protein N5U05_00725 [Aliarcobacter butzleri]|uniref:hypothetical protein n=1 Tax=Aliarcobacter butzleri TaxID=28197 RepID=UPI0021B3EF8B|nr:hypothetical protein [Aliarcobacter butzleri]MCT7616261.1 hypothetical protein [Aliarcobacter butzleri]
MGIDTEFTNAITALSSLLLVIATIVYVTFTYKLFAETKKLREVETSPFISLVLSPFRSSIHLSLKIKNIGKAPAYNISFEIEEKYSDIFRFNFKNNINYFSPEQEIEAFGKEYAFFIALEVDNIPIKVIYYSKDKTKYEEVFLLEWNSLDGILLGDDNLGNIEKHLKKISENFEKQIKVIQNNKEIISRIAIIEIEKTNFHFKCLFNNGYLGKIANSKIKELGLNDLSKVELVNNQIHDKSISLIFKSEEIYYKFLKIENERIKYEKI